MKVYVVLIILTIFLFSILNLFFFFNFIWLNTYDTQHFVHRKRTITPQTIKWYKQRYKCIYHNTVPWMIELEIVVLTHWTNVHKHTNSFIIDSLDIFRLNTRIPWMIASFWNCWIITPFGWEWSLSAIIEILGNLLFINLLIMIKIMMIMNNTCLINSWIIYDY